MVLDWLAREGLVVFSWWLYVTLAGIAALPITMRLLGALPDKGYILARSVGILLVGFVFWTLAILGFLQNTSGSIILSWVIVVIGGWILYFTLPGERPNWRVWLRENATMIGFGEVLFIVLLLGWALFRAYYPNLTGTEKPMEIAFMSAIQRSSTFPPNDPWMSGYSISYYHFGYILAASLSTLSGISAVVGFNMMIALLFALTGLNSYGVVYNLVRARINPNLEHPEGSQWAGIGAGILGMVFVVLMGNFQLPLLELPYQSQLASDEYFQFWDAQDRQTSRARIWEDDDFVNVAGVDVLHPTRWDFWWWFRASRVINDRHFLIEIDGREQAQPVGANVIDEFPQFSFLLADVHPHVLALPFSVMLIGLALNLLLSWSAPTLPQKIFYGLAAGGLMFLNMWDGPIYMVVLVGAEGLRRVMRQESKRFDTDDWISLGLFFLSMIGLALFFYMPFFISFRSQASGIVPNLEFPTLFRQYFIMFGPFIMLLIPYLIYEVWNGRNQMNWRMGGQIVLFLFLGLLGLMVFLTIAGAFVPVLRQSIFGYVDANGGWSNVLPKVFLKRLTHSVMMLAMFAILVVIVARLVPKFTSKNNDSAANDYPYSFGTGFALLMVACAAGLSLVPEFIYLRDNFAVRINTIFKFYYQVWVMLAIASAYAVYVFISKPAPSGFVPVRILYGAMGIVVLVMGLLYPILGIHNRAMIESGRINSISRQPLTLDGGPSLATDNDYRAMMCLSVLVGDDDAIVAEAIGPAYRHQFGRVGVLTGIPIVLGWENHERQWRGSTYGSVAGTRRADIESLYNDFRWDMAVTVIQRYDIDYIFYGSTERYGGGETQPFNPAGEEKFRENLEIVCEFGDSLFYKVTPNALKISGVLP